jgi:hypothetical protein
MTEHCMPMDGMSMEDMAIDDTVAVKESNPLNPPVVDEEVLAGSFDRPIEACWHCMSHSGILHAPASFITVQDESRKAVDSAPQPVSSFLESSLTAVKQNGSPREHAPPSTSAPRHVLISVFLI